MIAETKRIESLTLAPTTPIERAIWLGATVDNAHTEIVVRTWTGLHITNGQERREVKESVRLRFTSSHEVAALEDALRVMRVRMQEHEHAALTK